MVKPTINPTNARESRIASTRLDITGKQPHYELREDGSFGRASLDWDATNDPDTFRIPIEIP